MNTWVQMATQKDRTKPTKVNPKGSVDTALGTVISHSGRDTAPQQEDSSDNENRFTDSFSEEYFGDSFVNMVRQYGNNIISIMIVMSLIQVLDIIITSVFRTYYDYPHCYLSAVPYFYGPVVCRLWIHLFLLILVGILFKYTRQKRIQLRS